MEWKGMIWMIFSLKKSVYQYYIDHSKIIGQRISIILQTTHALSY